MLDYLIMLLSADWCRPYWTLLGIDVDEEAAVTLKAGSREIVKQMMGDAKDYYLIDLSSQRRDLTEAQFKQLLAKAGLDRELAHAVSEWQRMTHAQLKDGWKLLRITKDLLSPDIADGRPLLDATPRAAALQVAMAYELEPPDMVNACVSSRTVWDRYLLTVTSDPPEMLPDLMISVLRVHVFNRFWDRSHDQLKREHMEALKSWFRAVARFRGWQEEFIPD